MVAETQRSSLQKALATMYLRVGHQLKISRWKVLPMHVYTRPLTAMIQLYTPSVFTVGMVVLVTFNLQTTLYVEYAKTMEKILDFVCLMHAHGMFLLLQLHSLGWQDRYLRFCTVK